MIYKEYPYLQDSYYEDENSKIQRQNFLSKIDNFINQKQYVKIILLNWKEEPLKEIQGEIISGSISKDGSSSVRRTAQISVSLNRNEYNIEDIDMDFSINKKIFLEIGLKNYTNQYKEYPILWFPQGVFFIGSFNLISSTTSAVNLKISLKDKMACLNGDIGGSFQSTTILDEVDTQLPSGEYVSKKVTIYDIILEIVNHFGGEDLNNIVIEDLDTRIKQVVQWRGSNPLYLINNGGSETNGDYSVIPTLDRPDDTVSFQTFSTGDDIGYIYTDFTWTDELTAAPGDSVVTILDKIKSALGNYEYFYDVFGVFHFREIKNYLNTTQGKILLEDMNKNDYLVETTASKSVYTFSDDTNLISISVTPKYENIKNDYIVHGTRKMTNSDISYDVMYHLAIDTKPVLDENDSSQYFFNFLIYREESTNLIKGIFPTSVDALPQVGDFNLIYKYNNKFYFWEGSSYKEVEVIKYIEPGIDTGSIDWFKNGYHPKDWRTLLYIKGLLAQQNATDAGYYYAELAAGWPQIYNIAEQKFHAENQSEDLFASALTDGNYFLDFIDPSTTALGEFSVSNIGRRTDVVSNDEINCLFQPEIPNLVFINTDDETEDENNPGKLLYETILAQCQEQGQPYCQINNTYFYSMAGGGYKNGAFDQIKYELYLHTNYQKGLSLSALPIFYLEPNSRITINDKSTNTYGDYVISNLSMTLGPNANMSVGCAEIIERF